MTRQCCVCRRESSVSVVRFHTLKTGYPMGAECYASWGRVSRSLGVAIENPAKVQVEFRRWMAAREKVAA